MERTLWCLLVGWRVAVLVLGVVADWAVLDHQAHPRDQVHRMGECEGRVGWCAFLRWDAAYFGSIASSGYQQQHWMAFFPLWPLCLRWMAAPLGGCA